MVPTGFASSPREMTLLNPPENAVARNFNLVNYSKMQRAGHFAFWEQPELMVTRTSVSFSESYGVRRSNPLMTPVIPKSEWRPRRSALGGGNLCNNLLVIVVAVLCGWVPMAKCSSSLRAGHVVESPATES
jgi:hypothetical protein